MVKVNLGCGKKVLVGYQNFDLYPINKKVKKIDLNNSKDYWYKLENLDIDLINMDNVLEHLEINEVVLLNDLYLFLKKDGKLIIKVPNNSNQILHLKKGYDKNYFNPLVKKEYFTDNTKVNKFKGVSCRVGSWNDLKGICYKLMNIFYYIFVKEWKFILIK